MSLHQAVLLQEVLNGLALQAGQTVVDATINHGGHALAIAEKIGPTGWLIGIDQDADALKQAEANLSQTTSRRSLICGNFRQLDQLLSSIQAPLGQIDAILMDLGWSSDQLQTSGRGFSFQTAEPLLMTYHRQPGPEDLTAGEIVNQWSADSLADIIYAYGEERFSRQIATAIVTYRQTTPITTSQQLAKIISQAVPSWYRRKRLHPATKTFQALRITVNDELGALSSGLTKALEVLAPGGRLAVISFHSLESRLIKDFFQQAVVKQQAQLINKHLIKPTFAEIKQNPRARSAGLRILRKN